MNHIFTFISMKKGTIIVGQNFRNLTIVGYGPLRSKMFCLLLCELQVRTRQSRCIEVVHPYFQFMISCSWFLRIIWDSFWILKRRKGVKGPGAKNDTSKSPGCFNQILTFGSRKWSLVATFKSALSFFDFLLFHVQIQGETVGKNDLKKSLTSFGFFIID